MIWLALVVIAGGVLLAYALEREARGRRPVRIVTVTIHADIGPFLEALNRIRTTNLDRSTTMTQTEHPPVQTAAELRAGLLVHLERMQARVDEAQAEYDVANEKHQKLWRISQGKYQSLEQAKERRDQALAELQSALPAPDPDRIEHAEEVGR